MMRTRVPLQHILLAAGAGASLACYAVRAVRLPRSTSVGVEHRLFGGTHYQVLQNPANGRWLVSIGQPPPNPTPAVVSGNPLPAAAEAFQWPGKGPTGRTLAPFRKMGTWELAPFSLRRVWRLSATETRGTPPKAYLADAVLPALLDLRQRRTYHGPAALRILSDFPLEEEDWVPWSTSTGDDLEISGFSQQQRLEIQGRRIHLLWNDPPVPGSGLYAASDHAAPRAIRLAADALYTHLSPDGRTLFFQREGALWRLDLRRPLPELLDQAVPPPLPEPDLDERGLATTTP